MPPPFSTRHHAYLQAYHATGKGAILNCMRELVALHKVRAQQGLPRAAALLIPHCPGVGMP